MLNEVLNDFELVPDFDLMIMRENQSLSGLLASIISKVGELIDELKPDLVLVHGDTSTTLAASIAAFQTKTKIAHIEAGLRSGSKVNPFPEEMNRCLVSKMADLHFAPTKQNKDNLLAEGIPKNSIHVTGNTVIDALMYILGKTEKDTVYNARFNENFTFVDNTKKTIIITCHRRESFGQSMVNICNAINQLCAKFPSINFVFPVHLNPNIQNLVNDILIKRANLFLITPLGYQHFATLLKESFCVLTDSGGIQEEAPALGKPVVVMRENTERWEGVDAGTLILAGTDTDNIVLIVEKLVGDEQFYNQSSLAKNPYGYGNASNIILNKLKGFFSHGG